MAHKDPVKRKEYEQKWYAQNRERILAKGKQNTLIRRALGLTRPGRTDEETRRILETGLKKCTNCEEIKQANTKNFAAQRSSRDGLSSWCKICIAVYKSKYARKLKQDVITVYGTICACCNETGIEFLMVHHTRNNGAEERRHLGKSGSAFYTWLKKNNYPKGYEVLCANCNLAIQFYGSCPHHQSLVETKKLSRSSKDRQKLRLEVLAVYSNNRLSCECCNENVVEFLSIDHKNGGGGAHRKKLSVGGSEFYRWLKTNNYPKEYSVGTR